MFRRFATSALAAGLMLTWLVPTVAAAKPRRDPPDSTRAAARAAPVPTTAAPAEVPLVFDSADPGFGAAVVFTRVPDSSDLDAIPFIDANVRHLVLSLSRWPEDWSQLEPLGRVTLPQGADVVVVLPGYPPTRSAAAAWNLLRLPLRMVIVVDGPPSDRGMIGELNGLRGLERVIADMRWPSRSGFERLQRPLSFRVVMP